MTVQSFIGLGLLVPEIIRVLEDPPPLRPLNDKKACSGADM